MPQYAAWILSSAWAVTPLTEDGDIENLLRLRPPDALKICGRCRNQPYCSLECQRSDWRRHKANCAPPAPPPPRRTNRLDKDAFRPVAKKALATKNTAGCRVGLRNEGNTCYLTCVLQCLTYSPLAGYLLELDVDSSNNMMAELQAHIRKVWKRNELLSPDGAVENRQRGGFRR